MLHNTSVEIQSKIRKLVLWPQVFRPVSNVGFLISYEREWLSSLHCDSCLLPIGKLKYEEWSEELLQEKKCWKDYWNVFLQLFARLKLDILVTIGLWRFATQFYGLHLYIADCVLRMLNSADLKQCVLVSKLILQVLCMNLSQSHKLHRDPRHLLLTFKLSTKMQLFIIDANLFTIRVQVK